MFDKETAVTDHLLDRPGKDSAKLAAVVASATAHGIKFTVTAAERAIILEAMDAVNEKPIEFVVIGEDAYVLQSRDDFRPTFSKV